MSKYLITIVGPTAIGKTSLSIALAQFFNTDIISADSRQFYKELHIGTAAPNSKELKQAKHHFIHHKSVLDEYSVGDFEREALSVLESLFKSNNVVVLVGGSGLYIDAILKGLDTFPKIEKSIREQLNKDLKTSGLLSLQNKLKVLDRISYEKIAIDNPHRVIRALEICIGTGKPYSSYLTQHNSQRPFTTITIGLTAERDIIYQRINERVDVMMKDGLLLEVKNLIKYKQLNALNTVGYKELFQFIDNTINLDEAVSEIKKNTRRYAKRQLTWFNKNSEIQWFDINHDTNNIIDYINEKIEFKD